MKQSKIGNNIKEKTKNSFDGDSVNSRLLTLTRCCRTRTTADKREIFVRLSRPQPLRYYEFIYGLESGLDRSKGNVHIWI